MKKTFTYISLFCLLIILWGCKGGGMNEGVVKYSITYLDSEKKINPIISLLPTDMEQTFKDGSSKMEIQGFMGMFRIALVSNLKDKTNSYVFKIMADKNYCQTKFGEKTLGFDPFAGIHLKKTNVQKEIAGLKARKVKVTFDDPKIEPYDIYFTDEIKIENPNWSNPYSEIPFLLMEFRVKMKNITMIIKANEVVKKTVDDNEFTVDKSYKHVTPHILDSIIVGIMNSANQ